MPRCSVRLRNAADSPGSSPGVAATLLRHAAERPQRVLQALGQRHEALAAEHDAKPGVTTTGPFNQHFIRDIGLIFLFVGTAFLLGAAKQRYRVVLWAAPTLWLGAHALFHFWEVAVGICAPSVLLRDFAAVTLPAIIGAGLTLWAVRDLRAAEHARASHPAR